ncbi:hypothetical protein [Hyalangium sp.]|uniref:hypothetical protein n=1 Tax=Hyalangium sp. TaxID=2028555 RepID=UPI002D59AB62|nr:hypothetical protein [Hyalangium sp.]HYH98735.1 hypothetical protein [Hyalangium sp.]
MTALPEGLEQSFTVAAGELGMACAAWLFVENVAREAGDAGVGALRDALGRPFPVLDAVAAQWLAGARALNTDPSRLLAAVEGSAGLVVVGLEAFFLDVLVARLPPDTRCALLCHSPFDVDWERVLSNYGGRVEPVNLESFQAWAGPRSVLLTFAYGVGGHSANVLPAWVRATGEDVRTQFRALMAWDVLPAPMFVYPRWLVEVDAASFTHLFQA